MGGMSAPACPPACPSSLAAVAPCSACRPGGERARDRRELTASKTEQRLVSSVDEHAEVRLALLSKS